MVSDFVHTTKTSEPHAKLIKSYSNITEYIENWLPKIKKNMDEKEETYLTDVYYHDIAARTVLAWKNFVLIYTLMYLYVLKTCK